MSRLYIPVLIGFALASSARGQRDPSYDRVVVPQTRSDARDLGYSPKDLIPNEESGITSLSIAPNGDLYGATSGTRSHLFMMNPQHGYVFPLGVIPGATSITQSLVLSATGAVFLGTAPAGHLLEYTPHAMDQETIEIGRPLTVTDHGVAIAGESIAALVIDRQADVIYGLTKPNAHLFRYSIATKKFSDLGVVAKTKPLGEKFETEKIISRMLVVDAEGNVFMSGEDGYLFEFIAKTDRLQQLTLRVPAIPGRESYARVDAFLLDRTDVIYGGTSDGYLFRLDPQKLTVANLGKPLNQDRIAGLATSSAGKLYGVGGSALDMARMFSYDPSTGSYDLLGFVDVNRRPYFAWQAYVIGALVSDERGTIYLGENERISKLYLYFP